MVKVNCKICKKEFLAKPSWRLKGYGVYCSSKCQYLGIRTGKNMPCFICGRETYKQFKQLKKSKSGKFFCSKSCQTKWRNSEFVGDKHGNWKGGEFTYRDILKRNNIPEICKICKTKDSRILAVHHIDKNHKNNKIENLLWLCHNCHHLVHHYKNEQEKIWRH